MQTKRNIKAMLILFCGLFVILCAYLIYIQSAYGMRWFASPYNTHINTLKNSVIAGRLLDRNGEVLAYTESDGERRYADSRDTRRALCHVVGDSYGQTMGAEATFSQYLLGFDLPISERLKQYENGSVRYGSDVSLTVDAQLARRAYKLMDDYWGCIAVMNYQTGEILASVSQPTFDPEEMESYLSGEKSLAGSAMVNRFIMGRYTPGSTFKLVTLVSALRHVGGVEDMTFACEGPLAFEMGSGKYLPAISLPKDYRTGENSADDSRAYDRAAEYTQDDGAEPPVLENYNVVRDYQNEYHGTITLEEAFADSCNTTFAKLAIMLGASRLSNTAEDLGVGKEYLFEDMMLYASSYEKPNTQLQLAWSGIGQYKDLMTPLQMCMLAGAVANDGVMMEPKVLKQVTTPSGTVSRRLQSEACDTVFTKKEAQTLKAYMRAVVEEGTGKRAALDDYAVCGKTGTAEIASDKSIKTHAWFVGFIEETEHPLAVCVILEQAGGGGSVAAPIAQKMLQKAIELGY